MYLRDDTWKILTTLFQALSLAVRNTWKIDFSAFKGLSAIGVDVAFTQMKHIS